MVDTKRDSVFNEVWDIYHSSRPSYPEELIQTLIKSANISNESNILEVGVGTGKLTLQLAGHGLKIKGIELGHRLAKVARKNLADYIGIDIVEGDFNEMQLPTDTYDMVVTATAFHWLEETSRVDKIWNVLKNGGLVAIIDTVHVDNDIDKFPSTSQKCYRKWDVSTVEDYKLPKLQETTEKGFGRKSEFNGKFNTILDKSFPGDITYVTEKYLELLQTYSDVLRMPKDKKGGFLNCITDMIDNEFNGKITKSYVWQLFLARKI